MFPRRIAAVLAVTALALAAAALLARGSTSTSGATPAHSPQRLSALEGGGRGESEESGGAAGEAYRDRAFPADTISTDEIQGAIAANNAVTSRGSGISPKWDFLGPDTLDVDRLGTQSVIKPTHWAGRPTALTVDPKCKPQEPTLYSPPAAVGISRRHIPPRTSPPLISIF